MAQSQKSSGTGAGGATGALAGIAIDTLPPELQSLLKPGKTSDRIQHAITWAARRDPAVVRLHHARNAKVNRFEDIRAVELADMDAVSRQIARQYRHRAALTGAVTSLPGGLWAIVAAGADVQLTAVYAVRMAAMIAQAYGYDTSMIDEQAHLADVLALAAGVDSLRGVGNWLTREGLTHLLPEVLPKLLARLSLELTEEQAAKLVGRLIPGVGAVVGGAIDYTFLRAAGERAITYYHNRFMEEHGMLPPAVVTGALPPGVPPSARVVEATVVAQVPAGQSPAALPAPVAVPAQAPKPMPVRRHNRPPERFGIYLAIFAMFALLITIAACAALLLLASSGIHNLFH